MYTTDQIVHNIWIRRALLTVHFTDAGTQIFSKHSLIFIQARQFFKLLSLSQIKFLQGQIREQLKKKPFPTVKDLLGSPDTIIVHF